MLHFHAKRAQITTALICTLLGFFLVTQLRGQESYSRSLSEQSEQDLGQIIRDLNTETDTLSSETIDAQLRLYEYDNERASRKTILNEAAQNLEDLKVLAGLTPVTGEGIEIVVIDKEHVLNGSDLLAIIEELRAGGAEAIALNKKRVVAEASFEKKKKYIYYNNTRVKDPYRIKAIGNPKVLYQAITLPGGIKDALSSLEGVSFTIKRKNDLKISAFKSKMTYDYAKPVKESE